jgi:cytoskeleton protein RodZ
MSEKDTETAQLAADETVGHWLRAAREKAGQGRDAVAEALHLDRATIQAIEDNDFERLGAGVFAKGHIKAYASHLSLAEADALERYYRTAGNAANTLPPLVVSQSVSQRSRNLVPQILIAAAALIVLTLLVLAVRFLMRDEPADTAGIAPPEGQAIAAPAAGAQPESPAETDASAQPARNDAPAGSFADRLQSAGAATPAATPAVTPPAAASAAPARREEPAASPAAPATGVTLRFSDECWYEVRDANGRRVATGTGQTGQVRTVRAERPLSITLGYAAGAEVIVDGEPFEIPPSARRGRRAIFSVP